MRWLIDEWKQAWRLASVWVYGLIGVAPDLYAYASSQGWLTDGSVPPAFVWIVRGLAAAGIAARLYRQRKPEAPGVR